jgi:hypothetical protein
MRQKLASFRDLFGKQLERLLNRNDWSPNDFWIQLHDDILYVLERYPQKYISLYSTIEMRSLFQNLDDIFHHNFEQTDIRKPLEDKLNFLQIPFDCSDRSL